MTGAPPVSHPVGRSLLLGFLLLLAWSLGAGAAAWALTAASLRLAWPWAALVLLGPAVLAGLALVVFWRGQRRSRLDWDGRLWRLASIDRTGQGQSLGRVELRLDLQRALLLRAQASTGGRVIWLWAQSTGDRARWHGLRCALYSGDTAPERDDNPAHAAPG